MHAAVVDWVMAHVPRNVRTVLECGALDINGSARGLFAPDIKYIGVDLQEGPGVDVVADFRSYRHPEPVDLVLCLEVLEHTPHWPEILSACARNLRSGGRLLVTCATEGRPPHSGIDGGCVKAGEHYRNISKSELLEALVSIEDLSEIRLHVQGFDLRAVATRV